VGVRVKARFSEIRETRELVEISFGCHLVGRNGRLLRCVAEELLNLATQETGDAEFFDFGLLGRSPRRGIAIGSQAAGFHLAQFGQQSRL